MYIASTVSSIILWLHYIICMYLTINICILNICLLEFFVLSTLLSECKCSCVYLSALLFAALYLYIFICIIVIIIIILFSLINIKAVFKVKCYEMLIHISRISLSKNYYWEIIFVILIWRKGFHFSPIMLKSSLQRNREFFEF